MELRSRGRPKGDIKQDYVVYTHVDGRRVHTFQPEIVAQLLNKGDFTVRALSIPKRRNESGPAFKRVNYSREEELEGIAIQMLVAMLEQKRPLK